jgi:N-acetylglucosaminyldiphosphoundecaprenol N-acetyl-beta-D-mannosaminyltransferase
VSIAQPQGERKARARVQVLGCPIDSVTMNEAVARVEEAVASGAPCRHVSINAAKLVRLQRDPVLREAIAGCDLVTADGQAVVWASRLLGCPVPARVAGIDLMEELLRIAPSRGYRVFLLGARPEVVERAAATIERRFPGIRLAGRQHGYFGRDEEGPIVERLAGAAPDLLFVALETPAKELFLARHAGRLRIPFAMGVGGAFDILAGRRRRAPVWLRRLGLEWLYRLTQDPRRLASRYLVGNTRFILLVLREALGGGRGRRTA